MEYSGAWRQALTDPTDLPCWVDVDVQVELEYRRTNQLELRDHRYFGCNIGVVARPGQVCSRTSGKRLVWQSPKARRASLGVRGGLPVKPGTTSPQDNSGDRLS